MVTYSHFLSHTASRFTSYQFNTAAFSKKLIDNYVTMSKYTPLVQALESPDEDGSFNSVAKRLGFNPAAAYNTLAKVRPDLLGPRSARLGFLQVNKTGVPEDVRAQALAKVLAGESVKDVAQATGVPAPTLYQMARKAREKEAAHSNVQASAAPSPAASAVLDVLTAQLQAAAAQLSTTPAQLLAALSARMTANKP